MTHLTTDEMADRLIRSLQENSAELDRRQRAERNARARRIALICLVFLSGIAVGALLVAAL
jgi:hypothetical protein